jgi:hypothetical protein
MNEKELNPAESLSLITGMINTAKNRLADDGFLIIFWGWLVFAAALVNYISLALRSDLGYLVWPVLMPAGGIFTAVYSARKGRNNRVDSYTKSFLGYCWTAFLIALLITLSFLPLHGVQLTYFVLLLLYGIVIFITGGILNFRPLIIGSLFSFAFAVMAGLTGEKEQYLCIAAALLCSYIIPGHLLRSKYRSQNV